MFACNLNTGWSRGDTEALERVCAHRGVARLAAALNSRHATPKTKHWAAGLLRKLRLCLMRQAGAADARGHTGALSAVYSPCPPRALSHAMPCARRALGGERLRVGAGISSLLHGVDVLRGGARTPTKHFKCKLSSTCSSSASSRSHVMAPRPMPLTSRSVWRYCHLEHTVEEPEEGLLGSGSSLKSPLMP